MAKVKVVPTAQFRPGKCAVSADTRGPFIDTGVTIPRYGRIYLSIPWVKTRLSDAGELDTATVKRLKEKLEAQIILTKNLEKVQEDYHTLVDAVTPYIDVPVETQIVEKTVLATPNEEQIEAWIEKNGAASRAVQKAKRVEPGSSAEWFSVYGPTGPVKTQDKKREADVVDAAPSPTNDDGPAKTYELFGQTVELDEVLGLTVKEVAAFCEEKDDDFKAALVLREFHLAEKGKRSVRKGVLEPLGYWDEEEDEALFPSFEEETDTVPSDEEE